MTTGYRLSEIGTIVTGKTPRTSNRDNFGGRIPFVTPKDFSGQRYIEHTERYLSDQGAASIRSSIIPKNTVMVTCIGSDMGKVGIASNNCVTNQQINSIIVSEKHDPLYVYYALSIKQDELKSAASGSAVPILNKSGFGNFVIDLPPLETQREIAHILGTLDDKIELNRKMSKTLEEIAQALYKHWFIDFEFPNTEGKPYKSSGGEMIDSELGPIPKGWRVGSISDLATVVGGGTPSTKEPKYWGGDIPFVTPRDLSGISSIYLLNTERIITQAGADCVSSGVLPAETILLSSRAPIGYTAILSKPSVINQGFIACKCNKPDCMSYLFLWIGNNIEIIKSYANGSTFMEINKDNFKKISVLVPTLEHLKRFSMECLPFLSSLKQQFDTNRHLIETYVILSSSIFRFQE